MKKIILASLLAFAGSASVAHAKIPFFNAVCGPGIEVHADEGGPVWLNGKEAKIKIFNTKAYEATVGHDTISITINDDGSVMGTYTGKGGANGVCTVK